MYVCDGLCVHAHEHTQAAQCLMATKMTWNFTQLNATGTNTNGPHLASATTRSQWHYVSVGTGAPLELGGGLGSGMGVEVALGGAGMAVQGRGNDHFLSSLMLLGSEKGPSRLLVSTARTAKWYTCPGMNCRGRGGKGSAELV